MQTSLRQRRKAKRKHQTARRVRRAQERLESATAGYDKAMRSTTGHPDRFTKPGSLQIK